MTRHALVTLGFGAALLLAGGASLSAQDIIYVDDDAPVFGDGSSWPLAFKDLQDALAVAETGDQIWVAEGRYAPAPPGSGRDSTFALVDEVELYGGFAAFESSIAERVGGESILSGDLNGDDDLGFKSDNCVHVVTASATSAAARLDGFVIEGGYANSGGEDDKGAGLYSSGGAVTVVGCTFRSNIAASFGTSGAGRLGAGLYQKNGGSSLVDCVFEDNDSNHLGGGLAIHGGSATLDGCTFLGNVAGGTNSSGGGGLALLSGADVTLIGGAFVGNTTVGPATGGAAILAIDSSLHAVNVAFLGNAADVGGGGAVVVRDESATSSFTNCLFSGNTTATDGGALLLIDGASPVVANCTLSGNAAPTGLGGGAFIEAGSSLKVRNTILWGNTDSSGSGETAQIQRDGGLDLKFSTVAGWSGPAGPLGGSAVLSADPLFADASGPDLIPGSLDDDLRLTAGSPCVDAGNDGDVPADEFDLDGDLVTLEFLPYDLDFAERFEGPVDHGAYERSGKWKDEGSGLAGTLGTPVLTGDGPLTGGSVATLHLAGALPFAPYYLIVGLGKLDAPFKGGVLVPAPDSISALPATFPGAVSVPFVWPAGVPPGTKIWFQYWIQDPGGPVGFSASNGLLATT